MPPRLLAPRPAIARPSTGHAPVNRDPHFWRSPARTGRLAQWPLDADHLGHRAIASRIASSLLSALASLCVLPALASLRVFPAVAPLRVLPALAPLRPFSAPAPLRRVSALGRPLIAGRATPR